MFRVYKVVEGDELSKIASHNNTTIDDLMKINQHIEDPNKIYIGMSINLPEDNIDDIQIIDNNEFPKWYNIAMKELDNGVYEIEGLQHNPRILEYHSYTSYNATDDETAWCSSFVNWCIQKSGIKGTKSAAARSWLKWGEKIDTPKEGCVVIFKRGNHPWQGHVGFYKGETHSHILCLGGNQDDYINIKSYPKKNVLGYRWK